MEARLDTSVAPARLVLSGEMTIYAAAALKRQLLDPLDECAALELDLSGIEEIDSAGLQLLLLAQRQATAAGKPFGLAALSRSVRELLELYDLAAFFGAPEAGQPPAGEQA